MQSDPNELQSRVSAVVKSSILSDRLRGIVLEADHDGDGGEFLRVLVEVTTLENIQDDDMEHLIGDIERAVSRLDDRFPSIRFSDAA